MIQNSLSKIHYRLNLVKTVETPLKTLDKLHVNQPKRFLPLTKEALKIAEALRKEQQAVQWAGIPPEKLVQEFH